MFKGILISSLCVLFLSACGKGNDPQPEAHIIKTKTQFTPEEQKNYAKHYLLLNTDGKIAPPVETTTKTWPFGLFLGFTGHQTIATCSASHIILGKVLLNAHCLKGATRDLDVDTDAMYIVFYNTKGKRDYAHIESILYEGTSGDIDAAILKIDTEDAVRWHVAEGEIYKATGSEVESIPPQTLPITIWSFDPGHSWPDFVKKYYPNSQDVDDAPVSVFKPRQCISSRTSPVMKVQTVSGRLVNITGAGNGERHVYIDECDRNIEHGNSGSLMTARDNFKMKVGTAFQHVAPSASHAEAFKNVFYWGNNRNEAKVLAFSEGMYVFAMGLGLDYLQKISGTGF